MSGKPFIPQIMLAALAVAGPLASADAQGLPPPPAGRSMRRRERAEPRRDNVQDGLRIESRPLDLGRLDLPLRVGAGAPSRLLPLRRGRQGAVRDRGARGQHRRLDRSPYRNQPGRFWFKGNFCDLSTN
jgi:hypothetical protein